ncbi:unnamed protein product [Sphenostylis stenocarpa]|uniref:TF-B3 domain-containing protein n=1 Tax=Sphenostylis stenocarpa TaxID=92480 RepID=A0AA86TKT6_9FABA|nr:unnamed protein product [Sphenostylis stenocarpa]
MKNLANGITLKTVVREFLAAKEKHFHAEYFSFLSADEDLSMEMDERGLKRKAEEVSNYNPSKRIKNEEGCNSNHGDDVQKLSLTKRVSLFQRCNKEEETNYNPRKRIKSEEGCSNSRSKFEYLVDAVSLFSVYEEERDLLKNRHDLIRNGGSVDTEKEQPRESGKLLPREFREKIQELNGREVNFVTEKKLFDTDLNPQNARLSIPPGKIVNRFLSESEELSLNERMRESKRLGGVWVSVLDPGLKEYKMCLKKWRMEKSYVYNLTKGWNQMVRGNDLKLHDTLQLWSFRVSSQLCFALVKM